MSLEDELKLQKANKKVSSLMDELNESKEKISELMTQYNEAKNKAIMLSGDNRSLQAEQKAMQANLKNVEILNDRIAYLEKERKNLDEQVSNLEKKRDDLYQDKENLLKEKSEILESKNEILQKITDKELEVQQKDQTIGELREKFKKSSSDLLNKTMEIEKLMKKLESMDGLAESDSSRGELVDTQKEEIERLKQGLAKAEQAAGIGELKDTVVIHNFEKIIEQIKTILPKGRSTIRLVLPDIHDIEKYNITDTLKKIPSNVILNLAANINDPYQDPFVKDIKNYCQLTNYNARKFIAINVDSSQFLIGIFKDGNIIGIYTEVLEFIDLFKQAIMEPFIKGRKLF
jgi:DNA repair exonuclease SbcCD ATPase subunit